MHLLQKPLQNSCCMGCCVSCCMGCCMDVAWPCNTPPLSETYICYKNQWQTGVAWVVAWVVAWPCNNPSPTRNIYFLKKPMKNSCCMGCCVSQICNSHRFGPIRTDSNRFRQISNRLWFIRTNSHRFKLILIDSDRSGNRFESVRIGPNLCELQIWFTQQPMQQLFFIGF